MIVLKNIEKRINFRYCLLIFSQVITMLLLLCSVFTSSYAVAESTISCKPANLNQALAFDLGWSDAGVTNNSSNPNAEFYVVCPLSRTSSKFRPCCGRQEEVEITIFAHSLNYPKNSVYTPPQADAKLASCIVFVKSDESTIIDASFVTVDDGMAIGRYADNSYAGVTSINFDHDLPGIKSLSLVCSLPQGVTITDVYTRRR